MVEFPLATIFEHLILAARWTVVLSLMAFVLGGLVGLALLLARVASKRQGLSGLGYTVTAYVQLFLAYFGLALFGIQTSAWTVAALALTLYTSAFLTEIWRGCVDAIPRGQWYAAKAVGFLVQVIKGTALASVIGFVELTKAGGMISNASFRPFLTYSCVALCYFALCFPVSLYAKRLERRLKTAH
jgi:polar amino acid transport system permease protein